MFRESVDTEEFLAGITGNLLHSSTHSGGASFREYAEYREDFLAGIEANSLQSSTKSFGESFRECNEFQGDSFSGLAGEMLRLSLWREIASLEESLSALMKQKDIKRTTFLAQQEEIARTSFRLKKLKTQDPYVRKMYELEKAVDEMRLADAVRCQVELEKTILPPPWRTTESSLHTNRNVSVTQGLRLEATSFFSKHDSDPTNGVFVFLYHINITNVGDEIIQLTTQKWLIDPLYGKREMVTALGVTGQQPVLMPGQNFEYSSACPIILSPSRQLKSRQVGKMHGKYSFAAGRVGELRFAARVPQFCFLLPRETSGVFANRILS